MQPQDLNAYTALGHVPQSKGLGQKVSREEWEAGTIKPLKKALPKYFRREFDKKCYMSDPEYRAKYSRLYRNDERYTSGFAIEVNYYGHLVDRFIDPPLLESFIDLALRTRLL